MADEKITTLSVDGKPAKDAFDQIAVAADNAGDKVDKATVSVSKTDKEVKKLAGSSRDYSAAARAVADSTQNLTRFSQAYAKALRDTANTEEARARIIRVAAARTIGVTMDQTQALQLLRAKHTDVTATARSMINANAGMTTSLHNTGKASRASAYQYQNLAYQMNDVVSGLAMGQRPMQVLAQQGGQIFQVFSQMNSPMKAIGGLLVSTTGLFTMAGGAMALAAYAGISYGNTIKTMNTAIRTSNGIVGLTTSQLARQAQQIAETGEMTEREALKVQKALVDTGTVGGENYRNLISIMGDVARSVKSEDIAATTEEIAKALGNPAKAAETLNNKYMDLTVSEQRHIAELARAGDIEAAQAELIAAMSAKLVEADTETKALTKSTNWLSNAWQALGRVLNPSTVAQQLARVKEELENARTSDNPSIRNDIPLITGLEQERDRLQALLDKQTAASAKRGQEAPGQAAIGRGFDAADKALPEQQKALREQAATLEKAVAAAKAGTAEYRRLSESYEAVDNAARTWISDGEREVLLARARAAASTMTAAEGQKYLAQKTAEINAMGRVVSAAERERIAKAALLNADVEYTKAMREQRKALGLAEIEAKANLAEIGLDQERQALAQRKALGEISAVEELSLAVEIDDRQRAQAEKAAADKLALLRSTVGIERAEIRAAERALTEIRAKNVSEQKKQMDAVVAAKRDQVRQLAALDAEAAASSATTGVDAKAENLRFSRTMSVTTDVDAAGAQDRAIAEERFQVEKDLLNRKLELAKNEPAERRQILDQIKALEEKHSLDLQKIDNQTAENRLAKIKSWTDPFNSAVNTMVSGYISGTQTMRQISLNAANYIASSYIAKFADIAMDWFNKNVLMAAWDQMFGAKKVAQAVATEAAVTGAKAAGATAQVGVVAAGEAAETGAVVAGETAKTSARAAGSGAGLLMKAGAAIKSIAISAYEAAAGAYAAVASIPYIGPFIAPVVAAGAMASVFAFGKSIVSSEGGLERVPADGTLAELHKNETVLPASYAVPMRALLKTLNTAKPITMPGMAANVAAPGMALAGPSARSITTMPSMDAGTALNMPRYGLPEFLTDRPDFSRSSVTNNTTQGGDVHFRNEFHVSAIDARGVDKILTEHGRTIAKVMVNQVRNGNADARYASRRK